MGGWWAVGGCGGRWAAVVAGGVVAACGFKGRWLVGDVVELVVRVGVTWVVVVCLRGVLSSSDKLRRGSRHVLSSSWSQYGSQS